MSRSVPTLSASYSRKTDSSRLKREKVIQEVIQRKELPISVYYRTEASRKRKFKGKKYKSWDFYADNENIYNEVSRTTKSSEFPSLVSRKLDTETTLYPLNLVRREKKVAFDVRDEAFYPERLPNITPVSPRSRPSSRREKMSAMTIYTKGSPQMSPRKDLDIDMFPKNMSDVFREYWQEDGDMYKISFRQDSRGKYDPNSELHSDYYSVSRVSDEMERKIISKSAKKATKDVKRKHVTFPPSTHKFSAMLIGTPARLHQKHHLDDRYFSESIEELINSGLAYQVSGHTPQHLLRKYLSW